jgi:hypothetical protein
MLLTAEADIIYCSEPASPSPKPVWSSPSILDNPYKVTRLLYDSHYDLGHMLKNLVVRSCIPQRETIPDLFCHSGRRA